MNNNTYCITLVATVNKVQGIESVQSEDFKKSLSTLEDTIEFQEFENSDEYKFSVSHYFTDPKPTQLSLFADIVKRFSVFVHFTEQGVSALYNLIGATEKFTTAVSKMNLKESHICSVNRSPYCSFALCATKTINEQASYRAGNFCVRGVKQRDEAYFFIVQGSDLNYIADFEVVNGRYLYLALSPELFPRTRVGFKDDYLPELLEVVGAVSVPENITETALKSFTEEAQRLAELLDFLSSFNRNLKDIITQIELEQ